MAGTWIVVADSARARIFTPIDQGQSLEQVKELLHPESRTHERELATDRPGRTFDSAGTGRHAMSENIGPKEHEAWKLCKHVAEDIETARTQGRFDRLVIAAEPAVLGELRKALSKPASRLVVDALDKNLAQMDAKDIVKHLPSGIM